MTSELDPRRHPFRDDLAAVELRGRVSAPRYVEGEVHQVAVGRAPLWGKPETSTPLISELIFGERFTVYDQHGEWAWGQNGTDGYVGWARIESLAEGPPDPATHVVADLRAFVFPAATLKMPAEDALPLGTRVAVVKEERGYAQLPDGAWIYAKHLRPIGWREPDPVVTAERLLGVPYLWGGRTPWGVDCSGLVQLALACAGISAPRDSDMQRDEVGELVNADGTGYAYQRGDLVFFPGHVGLMLDERTLIHATAFTMTVTLEPVADVAVRAAGVTAVRRLKA